MGDEWLIRKFLEDQDTIDLGDERIHVWEQRIKLVEMVQHEITGDDLGRLAVLAMAERTGKMCWAFLDTDLAKRKAAIEAWLESRKGYLEIVKSEFGDPPPEG